MLKSIMLSVMVVFGVFAVSSKSCADDGPIFFASVDKGIDGLGVILPLGIGKQSVYVGGTVNFLNTRHGFRDGVAKSERYFSSIFDVGFEFKMGAESDFSVLVGYAVKHSYFNPIDRATNDVNFYNHGISFMLKDKRVFVGLTHTYGDNAVPKNLNFKIGFGL